jgi:hypothetical protein
MGVGVGLGDGICFIDTWDFFFNCFRGSLLRDGKGGVYRSGDICLVYILLMLELCC